jgi:CHAD domain-containing protein
MDGAVKGWTMSGRFCVPGVEAHTPLRDAAPLLLCAKADRLFALEEAVRSDADEETVHDTRVASRRFREALRLLSPAYERGALATWRKRGRSVTRVLGPVRDADVFIRAVSSAGEGLDERGRRAVAFAIGHSLGQRERDVALLQERLRTRGVSTDRRAFDRAVRRVSAGKEASRPLVWFARRAVAVRLDAVSAAQRLARESGDASQYHALRIAYKRLRYAVEVVAPCYGGSFDDPHATLRDLQDALGEMHDAEVFVAILTGPRLVDVSARAGIRPDDLDGIRRALASRGEAARARFADLCSAHPLSDLGTALLAPLDRGGE